MYAAILKRNLVLAVNEANLVRNKVKQLNQEQYYCPHCHRRVLLILSEERAAFFKHVARQGNYLGEREEHHSSKLALKTALTAAGFPAQIEIPLADGQLRADVLANQKLAFEVQCAPLSAEEFAHRHHLYQQVHIMDIWVVGKRHYLGQKLKKSQMIFFRKNRLWHDYYLEIDIARQVLRLQYNVQLAAVSSRLYYQTANFSLDEIGMEEFWHFTPKLRSYNMQADVEKHYLELQMAQQSKLGMEIAQLLYQQHLTIADYQLVYLINHAKLPVLIM